MSYDYACDTFVDFEFILLFENNWFRIYFLHDLFLFVIRCVCLVLRLLFVCHFVLFALCKLGGRAAFWMLWRRSSIIVMCLPWGGVFLEFCFASGLNSYCGCWSVPFNFDVFFVCSQFCFRISWLCLCHVHV